MKDSLLSHALFKDLFFCSDVQVGERRIQEVEVSVFIHSPERETHILGHRQQGR